MSKNICFPKVFKCEDSVAIVYWNKAEYYGGHQIEKDKHGRASCPKRIYRGADEKEFNPFDEIDMLKGNGYREVHYVKEDE